MFVYAGFENLGIEYLSAVLKMHGHKTRLAFDPRLFDDQFIPFKFMSKAFSYERQLLEQVVSYQPDLVVFSVVSSDYAWALRISRLVKERFDTHVVFGGIHSSSAPLEILKNDWIDFVISGEGEFALLELVDSLERSRVDPDMPNLCLRHNGKCVVNPPRPYIKDLDCLPFPDKSLYYDIIPAYASYYTLLTRRGCKNACSYCHNAVWRALYSEDRQQIRLRSVDNVMEELGGAIKKYRFKFLRINDDLFTSDEAWLGEFCAKYKSEINVPFICFASPATINLNVVRYLKEAGCFQVCMGVQSINDALRNNVLNRFETKEDIVKAIRLLKEFKIRCVADNIIGLPGESENEIAEMADFYLENPVKGRIAVFWLIYFPRTPIIKLGLEAGCLKQEQLDDLAKNPSAMANTLQGVFHKKEKRRYHLLLLFIQLLPKWLGKLIVRKKLYRYFPAINPAYIEIPYTLFSEDRFDPVRRRYYIRYMHFISQIMRQWFSKGLPCNQKHLLGKK